MIWLHSLDGVKVVCLAVGQLLLPSSKVCNNGRRIEFTNMKGWIWYGLKFKPSMDPSEVEFLGEKRLVSIIPNFNLDVIYLISGSVGPFRAGLPVKVPIWLAVCLKQKQKCRIINQEWMEVEDLNERKEMEKMSKYVSSSWKFITRHSVQRVDIKFFVFWTNFQEPICSVNYNLRLIHFIWNFSILLLHITMYHNILNFHENFMNIFSSILRSDVKTKILKHI